MLGKEIQICGLQKPFEDVILKIRPMGIFQKLLDDYTRHLRKDTIVLPAGSRTYGSTKINKINLRMLIPVFMAYVTGILLSIFIFVLEYLANSRYKLNDIF